MKAGEFGVNREALLEVVAPIAKLFPEHHPAAADINEALDPEVDMASCAVRAYGAGLLLRRAFPNPDLYQIDFGYADNHGKIFNSSKHQSVSVHMGHAACRFQVPGFRQLIIESDEDATIQVIPPLGHENFVWKELTEGYTEYLQKAQIDDVVIDPDEITEVMVRRIEELDKKLS